MWRELHFTSLTSHSAHNVSHFTRHLQDFLLHGQWHRHNTLKSKTQKSKLQTPNPKHQTPNTKHQTPNTKHQTLTHNQHLPSPSLSKLKTVPPPSPPLHSNYTPSPLLTPPPPLFHLQDFFVVVFVMGSRQLCSCLPFPHFIIPPPTSPR